MTNIEQRIAELESELKALKDPRISPQEGFVQHAGKVTKRGDIQ